LVGAALLAKQEIAKNRKVYSIDAAHQYFSNKFAQTCLSRFDKGRDQVIMSAVEFLGPILFNNRQCNNALQLTQVNSFQPNCQYTAHAAKH
jgi:hypothetical protein